MDEITRDDAQLLLSGLSWMCSEGAAEHVEVVHLVRRLLSMHPDLESEFGYMTRDRLTGRQLVASERD